jgi:hypothetical protein
MKSLPMPRYSRKENLEYWLKMFQATANVQGWTSDEGKLMVIPMFFKSEVKNGSTMENILNSKYSLKHSQNDSD